MAWRSTAFASFVAVIALPVLVVPMLARLFLVAYCMAQVLMKITVRMSSYPWEILFRNRLRTVLNMAEADFVLESDEKDLVNELGVEEKTIEVAKAT